jgi:hypothetical protein
MNARFSCALLVALSFVPLSVAPVRADDPKLTPDQIKAQQKEKDLKKAHDDLDKEFKAKKVDPAYLQMAHGFLDKMAQQVGLDVKPSVDLVHKVAAKKIPWGEANVNADEIIRASVDAKTSKIDLAKFTTAYNKWISGWKPPAPAPATPPPAANPPPAK